MTLDPNPLAWPKCSACHTPYVLRHCAVIAGDPPTLAMEWCWQRDCARPKSGLCKNAPPEVAGDPDAMLAAAGDQPEAASA